MRISDWSSDVCSSDLHIYDLTGNAENKGAFILSNPVDSEIPMGESLSTLLKLPLWGWGDEKIGFVSTMDLPTIDECMRYEALSMLDGRTPEQDQQLEALRRREAGWLFRYPCKEAETSYVEGECLEIGEDLGGWRRIE